MDFKTELPDQDSDVDQVIDAPEGADALESVPPEQKPVGDWASSAARYEWADSYGDVAPRVPELEEILFEELDLRGNTGLDFDGLLQIPVCIESVKKVARIASFGDAGLHPVMLDNIELCGYKVPTPIQQYCIPAITQGHDLLACAQTGSGKTAAFLIPIISKLMGKAKKLAAPRPTAQMLNYRAEPLVLVIAPTRELATQIFDESRRFCYRSMLRPCVVYGGADIMSQRAELEKGCDLLVATPGRLLDFLERGRSLSLRRIKFAVVDEADQMLDMGFGPQLRSFFLYGDINRDDDMQITMFSATYPVEIMQLAKDFLSDDFIQIAVGRIGSTHKNITQRIVCVEEGEKRETLSNILINSPPTRTLIFANHKTTVDTLDDYLYGMNFPCTSIHSDRTQREREDALRAFRSGRCPIMVATNVAARGLDIKNIMHIVNYDLPQDIDEYVHRIGRTARIGNRGLATTFFNESNSRLGADLINLLEEAGQEIPQFLEQYRDGATTQTEKKFDALDQISVLGKLGTEIFNVQTAGGDSWDNPSAISASGSVAKVDGDGWGAGTTVADDGWGTGTTVADDCWGTGTTVADDSWGVGTTNTGSSW